MSFSEVTFAEAIKQSQELLERIQRSELTAELTREKIAAMVSSAVGARGFFVAYLTGNAGIADEPPSALVEALEEHSEIVCDLLTKNLVMSTTMALTHEREGDLAACSGSKRVAERTSRLIALIAAPEMKMKLAEMQSSIDGKDGSYEDFLKRWQYDHEQLSRAREAIAGAI